MTPIIHRSQHFYSKTVEPMLTLVRHSCKKDARVSRIYKNQNFSIQCPRSPGFNASYLSKHSSILGSKNFRSSLIFNPSKTYFSSANRIPVHFNYITKVCYSKTARDKGKGNLISFDYAIKFLLKNKENYEVIENFISSLIGRVGYPKIRILGVKDPENQKAESSTKITIPDLLVEDENGKRYLIEVERNHFSDAAYKANYNTSYSTVHDFIDKGENFHGINKVIHISILHDKYGGVDDYLYHGKMEPKGLNNQQKLVVYKYRDGKKYNSFEDFPEYFFVYPDNFHEEYKDKFDEWMNLLKNGEIREEAIEKFKDLKNVEKRLNYLNLSQEDQLAYDKSRAEESKERVKYQDAEKKKAFEIAGKMLKRKRPIQEIIEDTGLSKEEVEYLQKQPSFLNVF